MPHAKKGGLYSLEVIEWLRKAPRNVMEADVESEPTRVVEGVTRESNLGRAKGPTGPSPSICPTKKGEKQWKLKKKSGISHRMWVSL